MKNYVYKLLSAAAVLVILGIFIFKPATSAAKCPRLVWEGDYTINSMEDLEALSGYTKVTGNLKIYKANLINLEGLECLTHVEGDLLIDDGDTSKILTSLKGIHKLKYIGGRFDVKYCNALTSVKGFKKLKYIGNGLRISDCEALESVEGFNKLKYIGNVLGIYYCSVRNVEGFNKLKSHLTISGSVSFAQFKGFNKIKSLEISLAEGGTVRIEKGFRKVKYLYIDLFESGVTINGGFKNLKYIPRISVEQKYVDFRIKLKKLKAIDRISALDGGDIYFEHWPKRVDSVESLSFLWFLNTEEFEWLENIKFIDGSLWMSWCLNLTSLQVFDNLESIGGNLVIEDNPDLCTSEAEDFVDGLLDAGGIGGSISVGGNKDC